jgi:hypothetical protein
MRRGGAKTVLGDWCDCLSEGKGAFADQLGNGISHAACACRERDDNQIFLDNLSS